MLYAIAPSSGDLSSLQTERLHLYDDGELVVFFEHRADPPARTTKELMDFARTLQQIWSRTSLLPIQFGSHLDDEHELAQALGERRLEWRTRLDRVRERSELIVHLPKFDTSTDRPPTTPRSGREYLTGLAERVRVEDHAIEELRGLLAPLADDQRALPGAEGPRRAFLVPDRNVEAAKAAIGAWADRTGSNQVHVTGPWPPFSFCEEVVP